MPGTSSPAEKSALHKRTHDEFRFSLVALDPTLVVDGILVNEGFMAEAVTPAGQMRETCPVCDGEPLQLVLRCEHVIRPHLFCVKCTRCYDAVYADGNSALLVTGQSIY
jgi:hypothetical protein